MNIDIEKRESLEHEDEQPRRKMYSEDELDAILEEKLARLLDNRLELEKRQKAEKAAKEHALFSEYAESRKDSDEPWVAIVSEDVVKGQLKMELDWNDAFIKHLREQRITGITEDEVVQKWMHMLMADLGDHGREITEIEKPE